MLIIDRFEGDYAVVETSDGMLNIPIADLPSTVKAGDVLGLTVDSVETCDRKKRVKDKMDSLFIPNTDKAVNK